MDCFYIGNVKIARTAALAPMAGVADYSFRFLAKSFGAAYVCGEMASAKGLVYNDKKTEKLLKITQEERPAAVQLFGSEPDFMAGAVEIASRFSPDIIDINAGCPVPKVAGNGAGCALMRSPELFRQVVTSAVNATDIPITVKIRAGWDENSINAVEIAKIAEQCGAKAVTVHGRTRKQMYGGKADLNIIKQVKNAVKIPVIGNGDVQNAEDCAMMYEKTGCDLVMLGRGAYGRPWIFRQIAHYLETGVTADEPCLKERLNIMKRHIELMVCTDGELSAMKKARKHAAWYIKGLHGAAKYRNDCSGFTKLEDLYELIERINNFYNNTVLQESELSLSE